MTMSQAIKEAYARAGSTTVHKIALELRHTSWPVPARMIDHATDVTLTLEPGAPVGAGQSVVFVGTGMEANEPELGAEPTAEMTITIDGVAGGMQALLEATSDSPSPIQVTIRAVALDTDNDAVVGVLTPYHLQVKSAAIDMTTVRLTMGRVAPVNMKFPRVKYSPETYPQLYR